MVDLDNDSVGASVFLLDFELVLYLSVIHEVLELIVFHHIVFRQLPPQSLSPQGTEPTPNADYFFFLIAGRPSSSETLL